MNFDAQTPVSVDTRQRWTPKRPLYFWIRLALGTVFIVAGADKIFHPLAFAKSIDNYQILPDHLVNLVAVILPWVELVLGSLLIAGIWLPGAIALANLLLATFFAALVFNVARGLSVDCGCFTLNKAENPSTAWYLFRDTIFLLSGGYLSYRTFTKPSRSNHENGAVGNKTVKYDSFAFRLILTKADTPTRGIQRKLSSRPEMSPSVQGVSIGTSIHPGGGCSLCGACLLRFEYDG
jgi:uncharacterized membrane protein YphA (DoxX/SURF4 family)